VSEPAPGEIRLQWWRDAIDGAGHGAVASNPIAAAFLETIEKHELPTGPLTRLIAARRFDLYQDPMPDIETFEGYAGETNSVVYQMAAMILGAREAEATSDAAGHLGVAHALTGHLRALGVNAARGRIFIPVSVLKANGVMEQQLFSGQMNDGLVSAVRQLAEIAKTHLSKAQLAIKTVPKKARPAFAGAALLTAQLRATAKASSPLHVDKTAADWQMIGKLIWWSFANT
jgi:phytoene synthase